MHCKKFPRCLNLIVLVFCALATVEAFKVQLYEEKHYKGKQTTVEVKGCTNVVKEWDDTVSSIDPTQCVIIFKNPNCQGPRVRLEPNSFGTAHLDEIHFEDKLSSIAPCNYLEKKGKDEH